MKVRLTKAQLHELQALEIDTLDDNASVTKRAFCDALVAALATGGLIELHGAALAYAARGTGAFGHAADIMEDQHRTQLATGFHNLQRLAFYASVHGVR